MKKITKLQIVKIIKKSLGNAIFPINGYDLDLINYGLDSMHFIRLVVMLEKKFKCVIPDSKLIYSEMNTINKIYSVLSDIETNS